MGYLGFTSWLQMKPSCRHHLDTPVVSNKAVSALQVPVLNPCVVEVIHTLCGVHEKSVFYCGSHRFSLDMIIKYLP